MAIFVNLFEAIIKLILLCSHTNIDCLLIILVNVVNVRQIIKSILMQGILAGAFLKVINSLAILLKLEVGYAKVVVQLSVIPLDLPTFYESFDALFEIP
jgi:hypothetical protein